MKLCEWCNAPIDNRTARKGWEHMKGRWIHGGCLLERQASLASLDAETRRMARKCAYRGAFDALRILARKAGKAL